MWAAIAVLIAAGMLIAGCTTPSENKKPTASMTADKYVLFVGESVKLNATLSKDPDGKVKDYYWGFGDGSAEQNTKDKEITHTYTKAGAFNLTLWVKDDKGGKSKTISDVIVVAPQPTASATQTDTFSNITFSVDNSTLGGRITDFSWSFGDGTPVVKGASVVHQYIKMGSYNISLTLAFKGQTASAPLSVKILNRAPVANITLGAGPYYSNKPVTFSGASSGDPDGTVVKWQWEFGDNLTDNKSSVTHSYAKPGTYAVKLTVTDNDNSTGVASLNLEVLKDMVIKNVTVETFVDPTNHTRAKVSIKIENKGDAKGPGTISVNVTSYKADKSVTIDTNSTTNGGTWEPNTSDNSISVGELLTDGFAPDGTWYLVQVFYQNNVIDSGWYQK